MLASISFDAVRGCGFVVFAAGVLAASQATAADPLPSDPVFTAVLTDLTTVTGRLSRLGPQAEVAIVDADGAERVIPGNRLLKLTRDGFSPALTPEGSLALVLLPDGDRLYRTVIGSASEKTLDVQSYALGNISIPLESLLGLILTPPAEANALDALLTRVRSEPRTSEVLWLANGDRLTGGFLGLDDKKVEFQAANARLGLERSGIVALGFDSTLAVYPKPQEDFLELTMIDGSRLGVSDARLDQGQVVATTRFGVPIKVVLGDVARIHARTSQVVYLSDRKIAGQQYVPYVGPTRPFRQDQTVDGHPLRLGGQAYDRGLGTQSRTLLAYRLTPGDRRFQALVGLDDRAGPLGNVVFRVLVDGRERFASPPMSVRDTPKPIDIDIAGAKVLILATEFGDRGDVHDEADWIEARIIR